MYEHSHPRPPELILGETDYRGHARRFGLRADDRARHLYVLGATGSGKSNLLASLMAQDLGAGHAVMLLDPHGDLAETVLGFASPGRPVLVLDPADTSCTIPWNPLQSRLPEALRVSHLVAVFRRLWADSWGPRLEHLLRSALRVVAAHPRGSLLLTYRFLTEHALMSRLAAGALDPLVQRVWLREFASFSKQQKSEALAPVLNKLGAFFGDPVLRRTFGYEAGRLDLSSILSRGGLVVALLSRARLGEAVSTLFGSLLLAELEAFAFARGPGAPPVHLYLDEFQHFAGERMDALLAEARKFGLRVTMAHQFRAQLPEHLDAAIRGNVGTHVYFRLGAEDARALAPDLAPALAEHDLTRLARHQVAVRLLADGLPLPAFTARTLRLVTPADADQRRAHARSMSRARFGVAPDRIDRHIAQFLPRNLGV